MALAFTLAENLRKQTESGGGEGKAGVKRRKESLDLKGIRKSLFRGEGLRLNSKNKRAPKSERLAKNENRRRELVGNDTIRKSPKDELRKRIVRATHDESGRKRLYGLRSRVVKRAWQKKGLGRNHN